MVLRERSTKKSPKMRKSAQRPPRAMGTISMAQHLGQVRDRANEYFGSSHPAWQTMKNDIIDPLREIGDVAVVGGLIRDLAFYGIKERPISDIDLVIDASPAAVHDFAMSVEAAQNRFGGYGKKTDVYKIDFWALRNSWVHKSGNVKLRRIEDLCRSTFFDWDAIVFSVNEKRVIADSGYLEKMRRRRLDINLLPNPSLTGNLVRALRRLVMWRARPGFALKKFIYRGVFEHEWRKIVSIERQAFDYVHLDKFENWGDYYSAVLCDDEAQPFGEMALKELELFEGLEAQFRKVSTTIFQPPKNLGSLKRRTRKGGKSVEQIDLFGQK